MENEKKCCCHHEQEVKEEVKSCCCHEKEEVKEEVKSCCCHEHEKEEVHSCCSTQSDGCGCCNTEEVKGNSSVWILAISFVSLVLSFFKLIPYVDPAWISIILCGKNSFVSAYKSVKAKKISTPILISVAMIASIVLEFLFLFGHGAGHDHGGSYIFAAGEIAFLMFLGGALEAHTVKKSKDGVKKLVALLPENARVLVDGVEKEILSKDLNVGNIVVVYPNEKIPADGIIISGESGIDNSNLTGEAMIVDVNINDKVYAGAWNGQGVLKIKVTKNPDDTQVAQMVKLTKEAQGKKAPISRVADKWASVLVPTAAVLSILVFLFTLIILKEGVFEAIVRGVSVLVVFCPCALTLATPTAVSAAIGAFSKQGVLVKSGGALEQLAKTTHIAFDKTGTLTKGKLEITDKLCLKCTEEELFTYLKTAEKTSDHPIARAIKKYNLGTEKQAEQAKTLNGVGVSCVIDGKEILVAKISEFDFKNDEAQKWQSEGKTVICVSCDNEIVGVLALADTIRQETKETISMLEKQKISCSMLTGDNNETAKYIGKIAGIQGIYSSLMPKQKTEIIENKKKTDVTVFVGDGVNDTPALATADVGISMSAFGNDIATENADVALFTEDIKVIPWLVKSSKRVLSTIKGNIAIAMTINFVAIILSALGVLNPVTGALVHNCTSVFVVGNSARLISIKR
ncbi:MAG: cadmium-translocating P-type ATPase [Clostridia bacterium]|nr:cadmium-translocating P-type ATPase [Clostridia bacterium]